MSTQQESGARVLPPWWIVSRDVGLFLFGAFLAYTEVRRPEIRDAVLILAGSLLGGPTAALGATSIAQALVSRGGTAPPSSQSQVEAPPPSSAASSSGA